MCCRECWEEVCCRECQAIPLWVGPLQLVDGSGFNLLALIVVHGTFLVSLKNAKGP